MLAGYSVLLRMCHEYQEREKRTGSSGYVRVEARGQECRIEDHLRCAGLEPGSPVPGVWFCAAGRTDGWNPDRKLCDRAGAD